MPSPILCSSNDYLDGFGVSCAHVVFCLNGVCTFSDLDSFAFHLLFIWAAGLGLGVGQAYLDRIVITLLLLLTFLRSYMRF